MKNLFVFSLLLTFMFSCDNNQLPGANEEMWYDFPAKYWNSQALHLGNGYMGSSFFGGIETEEFALSEKSIWTGKPNDKDWEQAGVNPKCKEALPKIKTFIKNGQLKEADELVKSDFIGVNRHFGTFSSIGSLLINFNTDTSNVKEYRRSLDLSTATGKVSFIKNKIKYSREYFCSYPDKIIGIKLNASKSGELSFSLGLKLIQDSATIICNNNEMEVQGFIKDNQRPFNIRIRVIHSGGELGINNNFITLKNSDEATIIVSIATNYKLQYPNYIGDNPSNITKKIIEEATKKGYDQLKERHIQDYRSLYSRVSLNIEGNVNAEKNPTHQRWNDYKKGHSDPGLKVLAFNLGRYLIISSSRPGTLPANLQGVWNIFTNSPWAGNYQSNINLQEIYWSCGPTALMECQEAYVDWVKDLSIPGKEIATRCYGTGGWVSHSTGNIWGHAAPIGGLSWGMYPIGSAWHCQHLWEHFAFTRDTVYLQNTLYPLMKGAAEFYIQNLTNYKGQLILMPSVSAEHGAEIVAGQMKSSSSSSEKDKLLNIPSPTQDAEMLWDLFTNTIEAAQILNIDPTLQQLLINKRDSLSPLRIGKFGQLQEWDEDIDDTACHHRHIAHLYAVCPGRQIDPSKDPELAKAAMKALDMRSYGRFLNDDGASGGNWSQAHRMWSWARLLQGEKANDIFTYLLTQEGFENLLTFQQAGYHWERKDQYNEGDSLYCHFQLDASASIPGFMTELLLQSHLNEIHLLPALPKEWKTGSVKGIRARGAFIIDLEWKDSILIKATIVSTKGLKIPPIKLNGKLVDPSLDKRINIKFL